MSTFNAIKKKIPVGSIMKGAQKITLSVATETSAWKRPESIALQQGPGFERAVRDRVDLIPDGTVDVCQREKEHTSDDPVEHYTGVCFDADGNGKSVHFPKK
ncbi:hypothetical protein N656DRAFT_778536 [Canariomyces notabilis]|uniref:Uncharacterized protein n=1 Tax=Canariomyces notabilis TaxID=2074819 RepID=A0AAN6YTY5_9PEZI|nr:hypothetical protein N656DRAFT_778536 [Canariomyces arenarius]